MKRMRYDQTTKAAILAAVKDARKSGKSWAQALEVAQQAGYKGTVGSITQFVSAGSAHKKTKPTKKVKAKRAVGAPAAKSPAVQSSPVALDITALVHQTVTDAVVKALEGLVASIKGGK